MLFCFSHQTPAFLPCPVSNHLTGMVPLPLFLPYFPQSLNSSDSWCCLMWCSLRFPCLISNGHIFYYIFYIYLIGSRHCPGPCLEEKKNTDLLRTRRFSAVGIKAKRMAIFSLSTGSNKCHTKKLIHELFWTVKFSIRGCYGKRMRLPQHYLSYPHMYLQTFLLLL